MSIFSPSNLSKAVHDTLDDATANIPEGKHRALLVDATTERARLLYVEKLGDNWQLAGEVEYSGAHRVEGKVSIAGSW